MLRPALTIALLLVTTSLAACDSAEERAEKHFASAEALAAEGDAERALVELRNVFQLDDDHRQGRLLYAGIMADRGDLAEAAASYTMVVEEDPDNAKVHAELGNLAITLRDWERAERHATRAYELDPAPALHRALYATVTFRGGDRPAALELARGVLEEDPANLLANTVLISAAMDAGDLGGALDRTDTALELNAEDMGLHVIRLTLLERLGRTREIGQHMQAMVDRFPDTPQIEQNLIRWYLREGQDDEAEAILRRRADEGGARAALTLARFLLTSRGADAALADLDARSAGAEASDRQRLLRTRAAIAFEAGDRAGAVADLEALIAETEASDETRLSQVALAQLYVAQGQEDEAAALVEDILAIDPDMVEALKMRARRLIAGDDTDGAIRDLRRALEQAPGDARILTLMADAHEREGAHELAGERMALAVQASGNARAESLRYARFLLADDRLGPAESVIVDALRRAPEDRALLVELGRIHLAREDYDRVGQIAAILERQDSPDSHTAANSLRTRSLTAQKRSADVIAFLEDLATDGTQGDRLAATVPLIRAYMREGEVAKAEGALTTLEADFPDNATVRLLRAGMFAIAGDVENAEGIYRALIDEGAGGTNPWLSLHRLLRRNARPDEAAALLTRGIEETGAARLMLLKASILEREDKDYEGAIALYEELYAQDSGNLVIANNLASMISTYRSGEEDLDRAFTIARRLRGTDVPPLQDTYGWLLARRGQHDEALDYLRPAAAALSDQPLVLYHLGVAEAGAGNTEAALEALRRSLSLGEADQSIAPQMEDAQARIAALEAAEAAEDAAGDSGN